MVKMVSPVECVGVCVNISTVDWSVRNTGFLVYSGKYAFVWGGRGGSAAGLDGTELF